MFINFDKFSYQYSTFIWSSTFIRNLRVHFLLRLFLQLISHILGENLRKEISKYHDEKAKNVQIQRDLEVAMWHQLKINNQEEQDRNKEQANSGTNLNNQDRFSPQNLPSYRPPDRSSKPKSTVSPPAIPDRSRITLFLGYHTQPRNNTNFVGGLAVKLLK